jgi:hypothetical protein
VGNPAEETYCYPNKFNVTFLKRIVNINLTKNRLKFGQTSSARYMDGNLPQNPSPKPGLAPSSSSFIVPADHLTQ